MKYYCEVIKTGEVYEGNRDKLIINVANEFNTSREAARDMLDTSDIDNPIWLESFGERVWIEEKR